MSDAIFGDKHVGALSGIKECEFLLKLIKDEIAAQSNTFDQIDNKTGVALGFTFVGVGQVLAAVFRMATDQSHFVTKHPFCLIAVFVPANVFVLIAILCGAMSRWPSSFQHSVSWEEHEYRYAVLEMHKAALATYKRITVDNQVSIDKKMKWAKFTYIFVGLALIFYIIITLLLFLSFV